MESEPILLTWRAAPGRHAAAAAMAVGLGGPLCALALLCLRDLLAVLGRDGAAATPFLRVALPAPTAAGADLVLARGWPLEPHDLELAALLCLVPAALALAGLGWAVAALCFSAHARAANALREAATGAILDAPAGARDEARALAALVGRAFTRLDSLLATGIVVPAATLGAVLLALGFAALAGPRLVAPAAVGLVAIGLSLALVLDRSRARTDLRLGFGAAAERTLEDLVRRMPAVRVHGAVAQERGRIAEKGRAVRGALGGAEARLAYARAPALALAILLPAVGIATALWRGAAAGPAARAVEPAALVAAIGAFALATILIAATLRLLAVRRAVRPTFRDIARALAALQGRRPSGSAAPVALPRAGRLVARDVGAFDPATGERLSGVDLELAMPAHVAIAGRLGSGSRVLAAVLAGQIEPTAGRVAYEGHDLRSFDPVERARRIAFAGGEAVLVEGSLRHNLLYGADPAAAPREADIVALLRATGLDAFVYTRGLTGRLDPAADPGLAQAVVSARATVRDVLRAERAERLVEPFDPALYNHQATVGENILFGEPVGPAFAPARLARQPYMRAVLEAEGLTRPLTEIGLAVARSTVEIFADLPADHPLFDAFSLFPASERGYFEDLVVRQPDAGRLRRGAAGQRDRERLIGLALRYSETRHRFGLIDEALEARCVEARRSFARMLPPTLKPAVEFYDPGRVNTAASLEENLLFGRISHAEAGAEGRVRALVRRVLAQDGLEPAVYRLGLDSRVETGGGGLAEGSIGLRERTAIDLIRCLIRRPDILVVAILPEERKPDAVRERLAGVRALRAGTGLIVCVPGEFNLAALDPFDAVVTVENSTLAPVAAEPALA